MSDLDNTLLIFPAIARITFIGAKSVFDRNHADMEIRPPFEWIYEPCDGPEKVLEIDLVGKLSIPSKYTTVLTSCDNICRSMFTVTMRTFDTSLVALAFLQIFATEGPDEHNE